MDYDAESYSEAELLAEFERLFPHGFAGPDVLQELAPAGWKTSPLMAVFHPAPFLGFPATPTSSPATSTMKTACSSVTNTPTPRSAAP